MRMKIKSDLPNKVFEFWMPDHGGHVYREFNDGVGEIIRRQICAGGKYLGYTIWAEDETAFNEACRAWYRSFTSESTPWVPPHEDPDMGEILDEVFAHVFKEKMEEDGG